MDTEYDVVIVGTGAAGLFTALNLPEYIRILMITKADIESSDSYLAQGGISVLRDEEDYDTYFEDTMRAGRYKNRKESVDVMIQSSREIIRDLIDYGVEFDCNEYGEPAYTREGGHSIFRIMRHKDVTGKEITGRLIERAKERTNVTIIEYETMIDLIESEGTAKGIIAEDRDGIKHAVFAKEVVLATGGIGGLFEHSTNFRHISGDSFATALRHNIELEDLQYIQIHPTTLYSEKEGRRFLISESVRGEGAVLLNEEGERFVDELLPRDVVTEAIKKEMERFHSNYVYLSLAHMTKEEIAERFPNILRRCEEEGYDLPKDMIKVTPSQHYLMGGIRTDTCAKTSMQGLYAVGETACNGVHGANRLASNSLLESLVFAKRAAGKIAGEIKNFSVERMPLDLSVYGESGARKEENRKLIMEEIRRRDEGFYDKWCDHKN